MKGKIMTKQVPEDSIGREEQLHELRAELLGNKVFGKLRGKFGTSVSGLIHDLIQQSTSPSDFCSLFDELSGNIRVMGNKLAQLTRDGHLSAAAALRSALEDPKYFFPGETVPIEETCPITVLMLDPERTLSMIKWICTRHWQDLDDWLDGNELARATDSLVNQLFQQFPTLERHSRSRREAGDYEGWDLRAAYQDAVSVRFPDDALKDATALELCRDEYNGHLEIAPLSLAYMVPGDQGNVLSRFSRAEQQHIASWQINVPLVIGYEHPVITFYPEHERRDWERKFSALVSKGVSQGFGLVFSTIFLAEPYLDQGERQLTEDSGKACLSGSFDFKLGT